MGQKKTWSFHHVPFTMLWETNTIDYTHNWSSIINTQALDYYSQAIQDKEYGKNAFNFVWKNKYVTNTANIESTKKKRKETLSNTLKEYSKINLKYSWISNANKGSNETVCVRSYLTKHQGFYTALVFFFREDFVFIASSKKKKIKMWKVIDKINQTPKGDKILSDIKEEFPCLNKLYNKKKKIKLKFFKNKLKRFAMKISNKYQKRSLRYLENSATVLKTRKIKNRNNTKTIIKTNKNNVLFIKTI